ncbi:6-phosphogluconolactonase [Cucumispora dikerogammari]|nr:6-phosphogluconolactonase [Cucumispora dikerogammari]
MHLTTTKANISKIRTDSIKREVINIFKRFDGESANIMIAGGSLYQTLNQAEFALMNSSNWTIYYADERLTEDEKEVNYILSNTFLQHLKAKVKPWNHEDPEANLNIDLPNIDLCILGIGYDGHICSIFPNSKNIYSKEDIIIVNDSPKPPPKRVSVTPHFLNKIKHVYFFIPKRTVKKYYEEPHESIMKNIYTQITVFIQK